MAYFFGENILHNSTVFNFISESVENLILNKIKLKNPAPEKN